MKGPHSYTAEDTVEIDCHGECLWSGGFWRLFFTQGPEQRNQERVFTKRAFLNGRLDLSQAEAVADVIHATNEYALKAL